MAKTVVLVEDMEIVREGLRALFNGFTDYVIIGEAADGVEALRVVATLTPDIVLMDLSLPKMDGTEAIREIKACTPQTKIIALTAHKKDTLVFRTLQAGADGYILKNSNSEALLQALDSVSNGKRYISPDISETLIDGFLKFGHKEGSTPLDLLSAREQQVLKLVAEGKSNIDIASALCISHKTVEKHKANLKNKLGVHSNAELATLSVEYGLLDN